MDIDDVIQDETFEISQIENPSNLNEEMNREEIDKESQQDASESTDDETEKFDKDWAQNCSEITKELTNMILDLIFAEKTNKIRIAENFDSKSEIEEINKETQIVGTEKMDSKTEEHDSDARETNCNKAETIPSSKIDDETKTKNVENAESQTKELSKGTPTDETEKMDSETEKLNKETNSKTENNETVDLEKEQNLVELSHIQAEEMEEETKEETDESDCEVEEIDMSTDGEEEQTNSFDSIPKKEEKVPYVTIKITADKKLKKIIEESKQQEERKTEKDTDGKESKTDKDTNEEDKTEAGGSNDSVYEDDNNTDRQVDPPKSCNTSKEIERTEREDTNTEEEREDTNTEEEREDTNTEEGREDTNTEESENKPAVKKDSLEESGNNGEERSGQTEEEDPSVHYRECLLCYRFFQNQDWLFLHIR